MKKIILYISLLFVSFSSVAQDSLAVYLKIAAENNPTVKQRFKEYKAALQKVPQVGSLPDPQLEMGVFLSPMEVLNGKQVADIKLMQMFPWWGVLKNAKDEMSQMAQMKYEVFRDAKLQVFYDVQSNWLNLYRIHHETILSQQNIDLLKSIKRMSVVQFSAGSFSGKTSSANNTLSITEKKSPSTSSGMSTMSGSNSTAISSNSTNMSSGGMGSNTNSSGLTDVFDIELHD